MTEFGTKDKKQVELEGNCNLLFDVLVEKTISWQALVSNQPCPTHYQIVQQQVCKQTNQMF